MESLEFSVYKIMSSANRQFYFFLSNLDAFISFSCLIALARTSSIMLNRSGQNVHPFLVLDLKGKAFRLSLLNMI